MPFTEPNMEKTKRSLMSKDNALPVASFIGICVAIVTLFGFWWNTANPHEELNKLRDSITGIQRELTDNYINLRNHKDLEERLSLGIKNLEKRDVEFLSKVQFEAWKTERDLYLGAIIKSIDTVKTQLLDVEKTTVSKIEYAEKNLVQKSDFVEQRRLFERDLTAIHERINTVHERINRLITNIEEFKKSAATLTLMDVNTHRIDRLYDLSRGIQSQISDIMLSQQCNTTTLKKSDKDN